MKSSKTYSLITPMKKMRLSLVLSFIFLGMMTSYAQSVAWGGTFRHELYNRYANPSDDIASRSAGSAIINIGLGPKLWIGGEDISFSPEVTFMWSPLALSTGDFKGLGALSFPILGKLEFFGNSNFNKDGKFGFSIGGGVQYSKTELWYLKGSFEEQGVERSFFRTYVIEADFGYGISGFDVHLFVRYGWANDSDANTLNIGFGYDFNVPRLKKATNSEF